MIAMKLPGEDGSSLVLKNKNLPSDDASADESRFLRRFLGRIFECLELALEVFVTFALGEPVNICFFEGLEIVIDVRQFYFI